MPVLPARVTGPDWMVRGHSLAHDTKCSGAREAGHVHSDLGQDGLRVVCADAGDLVEPLDGAQDAVGPGGGVDPDRICAGGAGCGIGIGTAVRTGAGLVVAGGVIDERSVVGQRGDQCLDARREGVDLSGEGVDLAQQHAR